MRLDVHIHTHDDAKLDHLLRLVQQILKEGTRMSGELDALKTATDSVKASLVALGDSVTSEIADLKAAIEKIGTVADLSDLPAIVADLTGVADGLTALKTALDADNAPA